MLEKKIKRNPGRISSHKKIFFGENYNDEWVYQKNFGLMYPDV